MCNTNEYFDGNRQKHLEFLETSISRMNDNSKQMKEWCIAIVSGLVGIYLANGEKNILLIGCIVSLLFAGLDAYYLLLERRFREIYKDVISQKKKEGSEELVVKLYEMPVDRYLNEKKNYFECFKSPSVWGIYIVALAVVVALFVKNPIKKDESNQVIDVRLKNEKIVDVNVENKCADTVYVKNIQEKINRTARTPKNP